MNSIPLISNVPGVNFSMNRGNASPEMQMRQEINTSLVALKREAGTLEGLINEAAQMLVTINNRIATLENDTVKKSDVVNVVQSGNLQPVTSNAVAGAISSVENVIYDSSITNCNVVYETGKTKTWWIPDTASNVPNSNSSWYILAQCNPASVSSDKYVTQIATCGDNKAINEMYIRHAYKSGNNIVWTTWEKLITNQIRTAEVSIGHHYGKAYLYRSGNVVFFDLGSDWLDLDAGYTYQLGYIPQGFRPILQLKLKETTVENITLIIETAGNNGQVYCYNYGTAFSSARNGQYYGCWITDEA